MENTLLVWQFLLEYPVTPWLAPISWHLLGVFFLLALLGGVGIHHLLSKNFGMYRVHDKQDPVLAIASLIVIWASMLVMLSSYVVGTHSETMVRGALRDPAAQASAGRIGQILMEPLFGPPEVDLTGGQPGTRGQLQDLLMAVPPVEYRKVALKYLELGRQKMTQQNATEAERVEKGLPPTKGLDQAMPSETPKTDMDMPEEAEPALALILLAMDWVSDPDQEWPEHIPQRPRDLMDRDNQPKNIPEAGPTPETKADPSPAPATPESNPPSPQQTPEEKTPLSPEMGDKPEAAPQTEGGPIKSDPFARDSLGETGEFPLPEFMTVLVGEIGEDSLLMQHDWEHVAGSRFMDWVMEPLLVWQVGYSAILMVVITLAGNIFYFYLLRLFRRWLDSVPRFEIRKTA